MNLKSGLSIFFLCMTFICQSQPLDFAWGSHTKGSGSKTPNALIVDAKQQAYGGGNFSGTVTFDAGNGGNVVSASSSSNGFLYQLSPTGQMNWLGQFAGTGTSAVQDLAVDNGGMIYAIGNYTGTVDFNPAPSITENRTSSGGNDVFLAKLDSAGQLIWVRTYTSTADARGYRIQLNHQNQLIIGGTFADSLHWNSGTFTHDLYSTGSSDVFITKVDTAGAVQWARNFSTTSSIFLRDIGVSDYDDVFFTGGFKGTCDFNPNPNADSLIASGVNNTIYLGALNDSGNFKFAFGLFGQAYSVGAGYSVASRNQHVYLSGSCKDYLDFDPGSGFDTARADGGLNEDMFVAKYTLSGQLVNYGVVGGLNSDLLYEIAIDSAENIYGCGSLVDSCDLDPGSGKFYVKRQVTSGLGEIGGYVFKWDKDFNFKWAKGIDGNSYSTVLRLDLDDSTNLYFNSNFRGNADFDPTFDTALFTATSSDVMTFKWGQCLTYTRTDTVNSCGSYSWHNRTLDSSGIYTDTLTTINGCDSITTLVLHIYPRFFQYALDACDSFIWNGKPYYGSGIFYDTLLSSQTCDSIVELHLSLSNSSISSNQFTACDRLLFRGSFYYTSQSIYDSLLSNSGCDSIIENKLIIHHSTQDTVAYTACDSFVYDGLVYYQSILLHDTLSTSQGCDSILIVTITLNQGYVDITQDTACASYFWRGRTLTTSGPYFDSLYTAQGCDSIFVLYVVIENLNDSVYLLSNGLEAYQSGHFYQWLDCANNYSPISGANSQSYLPMQTGNYAVEISASRCIDTSICLNYVHTGMRAGIKESNMVLYPNPGTGYITLAHMPTSAKNIEIYTAEGRLLHVEALNKQSEATISFDAPPGLYLIRVISIQGTFQDFRYIKTQ